MPWVVDTCLVIDVLDDDPDHGRASALLLDSKASDGLVLSRQLRCTGAGVSR